MKFDDEVRTHVAPPNSGLDWWEQLCSEADLSGEDDEATAHSLRVNVESTSLFYDDPSYADELRQFCKSVESYASGRAVDRAREAINDSDSMILSGPSSPGFVSGMCRLAPFTSFVIHVCLNHRVKSRGSRPDLIWHRITSRGKYDSEVDSSKSIRGALPECFWACLDDVNTLDPTEDDATPRLRRFLGLHDEKKNSRALLIQIKDLSIIDSRVPTGWDGFDNPYFRETPVVGTGKPTPNYGHTLDRETGSLGAKEVVSVPVLSDNTAFIRGYE